MSVWRRKALECLPELSRELEQPDSNIYTVFIEMKPILVQAHQNKDRERLKKLYSFAEWCFSQKEKELWNAAGVAFYEHLGDYPETLRDFTQWVKPVFYKDIRALLEMRMLPEDLKRLDNYYNNFRIVKR